MVFKAVKNIIGPNGLISTLFDFGAYFGIIMDLLLSSLKQYQTIIIAKVMSKLYKKYKMPPMLITAQTL